MITLVLSHYLCQYSSLVCPIGKHNSKQDFLTVFFFINVPFIFENCIEFNEALGKMTHSGCEFSFNFLPQEFELPATLATIRRMVWFEI